jgi:hypothetical protein
MTARRNDMENENQLVVSLNGVEVPVSFVSHSGRLLCVALPEDFRNDSGDVFDTLPLIAFFEGAKK